jgi:ribosomal protein S27E
MTMLRIRCRQCDHVGLVSAEHLPRDIVCSACGSSRHIEASGGKAIVSTARFEEYLAGERARPRIDTAGGG